MIRNFRTGYNKGEHALVVLGYYASGMLVEARKLWKTSKEQFVKVFEMEQKSIEHLDELITKGATYEALYDVIEAKNIIDEIFELGHCMEVYCTGEQHKQAPKGGEDFGFYLIECAQALYSGLELIDELDPLGEQVTSYLDSMYQSL